MPAFEVKPLTPNTWADFAALVENHNRAVPASFLYNSRLGMFECQGFQRVRQLGKNYWVVAKKVDAGSK